MHGNPGEVMTAARAASRKLKALTVRERLKFVSALKAFVLRDRERLIDRLQGETGKCRTDALISEIFPVLDHFDYLEKHASKLLADRKAPTSLALLGKSSWVYFEPLGVSLVISPWNYPLYQALVPITTSFITGNATIYKPSEHTPLQGLVEECLTQAGFERDWVQVTYGGAETGAALIATRPDKIFFTGSVATGKKILAQAAPMLIPVELELGGKDPMLVFEDANLERAAAGAAWGALTNCGQSCTSVERLYVHESIYEPFKKALLREFARIKQGVDADGDADVGVMTVDFQVSTVANQLKAARDGGARILSGGGWDGRSRQIPPLLLEGVKADAEILREETFGPVLPLVPFKTEQEAIAAANDSAYGLSASVWTADLSRARRVARALETGNVSINNVMATEGNHALPFGGVKSSGIGRYKGEFGLYAFSNIKSVLVDKNGPKIEANWYPYTAEKYRLFTRMMLGLFSGGLLSLLRFVVAGLKLESYSAKISRLGRSS